MINAKGVIIRYIICAVCFLISGTQIVTGWQGTICGVLGTVELATALLHYSPLHELKEKLISSFTDNFTNTAKSYHC